MRQPYIQLYIKSEADFFQSVVHGGRRPYVSPRWPRRLRKLLQLSWVRDPKKRPSFEDILNGKILEEVRPIRIPHSLYSSGVGSNSICTPPWSNGLPKRKPTVRIRSTRLETVSITATSKFLVLRPPLSALPSHCPRAFFTPTR